MINSDHGTNYIENMRNRLECHSVAPAKQCAWFSVSLHRPPTPPKLISTPKNASFSGVGTSIALCQDSKPDHLLKPIKIFTNHTEIYDPKILRVLTNSFLWT